VHEATASWDGFENHGAEMDDGLVPLPMTSAFDSGKDGNFV